MRYWGFACLLWLLPACTMAQGHVSFQQWLDALRKEALEKGISQKTLDEAFKGVEPLERVIELDRAQPESTLTMDEYLAKVINNARVKQAKEEMQDYHSLLSRVSEKYGVEPAYIVALWGIETNFGENTGGFSVIESLATLAYDGRRSDFFRSELLAALHIVDEDHIEAADMDGSWAGAMGQCQFMPSSFLRFAVDEDGDGKRDIWNSTPDVFGSIAHYLSESGWQKDGDEDSKTKVLLKWNRSRYFVAAVHQLAKAISGS